MSDRIWRDLFERLSLEAEFCFEIVFLTVLFAVARLLDCSEIRVLGYVCSVVFTLHFLLSLAVEMMEAADDDADV